LFWRQLRFGGNWLNIIFRRIVLEAAQIWQELALYYFLVDCFGGSSDLAGTGSTLLFGGLFLRQLRFGGNWIPIIFWWIVFGASSDLAGTGSTLLSGGLFWRQLRFGGNWLPIIFRRIVLEAAQIGGNWLHIIFRQIVLEAAQIWRELALYYFLADCFGGSSDLDIIFQRIVLDPNA
jgi:hypothetical protein